MALLSRKGLLAIAAVILTNLINGIAKFAAPTQPPFDRVFADVWASKPAASVRTKSEF